MAGSSASKGGAKVRKSGSSVVDIPLMVRARQSQRPLQVSEELIDGSVRFEGHDAMFGALETDSYASVPVSEPVDFAGLSVVPGLAETFDSSSPPPELRRVRPSSPKKKKNKTVRKQTRASAGGFSGLTGSILSSFGKKLSSLLASIGSFRMKAPGLSMPALPLWTPARLSQADKVLIISLLVSSLSILPALFRQSGEFVALTLGPINRVTLLPPFVLNHELGELKKALSAIPRDKSLDPGIFVVNLDNGDYVNLGGKKTFSAASIIKIPVMVSFLTAIQNGECKMTDTLTLREDLITGGSGFLQWRKPGSKISARDAARFMIVFSDNTATNLIIDLVGGKDRVNRDMRRWGLKQTKLNNFLADLEGTNVTSPYELACLLGRIERGDILNDESRQFMFEAMSNCRNRYLLPVGLGSGASIVHKTGTIGCMIGDAGIVHTPDGGRYVVAVQVTRNRNDRRANNLIRKMSEVIYDGVRRSADSGSAG